MTHCPPRFAALLLFVVVAGCGGGGNEASVKGHVTLDGQPFEQGEIVFENKQHGVSLIAPIESGGTFTLASHEGSRVPPGTYVVSVRPPRPTADRVAPLQQPGQSPAPPPSPIPEDYRTSATSDLRAELKAGANDVAVDMKTESSSGS